MAVVFLIGILGQPFELFNRAPVPSVEEEEACLCCCAPLLLSLLWRSSQAELKVAARAKQVDFPGVKWIKPGARFITRAPEVSQSITNAERRGC